MNTSQLNKVNELLTVGIPRKDKDPRAHFGNVVYIEPQHVMMARTTLIDSPELEYQQFDGLEKLNEQYRDKGLVIIGFPCNQFAEQDPGSDGEIQEFCRVNYGVTFQIMKKIDVNGPEANPIFEYLKAQAPSEEVKGLKAKAATALFSKISKSVEKESDIKWNFTKFLISRDGNTIKRYADRCKSLSGCIPCKEAEILIVGTVVRG